MAVLSIDGKEPEKKERLNKSADSFKYRWKRAREKRKIK